jgi:hypothetical protein
MFFVRVLMVVCFGLVGCGGGVDVPSPPDAGEPLPGPEPVTEWPAARVFRGVATVAKYTGPLTSGCPVLESLHGVSLNFGTHTVTAGRDDLEILDRTPPEIALGEVLTDIGGPAGREVRHYQLSLSKEASGRLQLLGILTYTRNQAAAEHTGCSGYMLDVNYSTDS